MLTDRAVDPALLSTAWEHGAVESSPPVELSTVGLMRATRYLSKSFADFAAYAGRGHHLYETAQGFQPQAVHFVASSRDEALERLELIMGGPPCMERNLSDYAPGTNGRFLAWRPTRRSLEARPRSR
jgi:hypothetical protein